MVRVFLYQIIIKIGNKSHMEKFKYIEKVIFEVLQHYGFSKITDMSSQPKHVADISAEKGSLKFLIEIKTHINPLIIERIRNRFYNLDEYKDHKKVIATPTLIKSRDKKELRLKYPDIIFIDGYELIYLVYDRDELLNKLKNIINMDEYSHLEFLKSVSLNAEYKIELFEEQLSENNKFKEDENISLNKEIDTLQKELSNYKDMLEGKDSEIKSLKANINNSIVEAKKSLAKSLENTDARISENNEESKLLRAAAKRLFYIDILLLLGIPILIGNPCDWDLLSTIQYKFIALSSFLGHWSILFYTLPILTILIIATTLLRHDQKLINEIRHFSAMKHQIELFSGLLEASQHAANSFNNPEKAAKYVEETFTMIRNKLLNIEGVESKVEVKEELDTNKTLDLLNKITDLVNKTAK